MNAYLVTIVVEAESDAVPAAGIFLSTKTPDDTYISAAQALNPEMLPVIKYNIAPINDRTLMRLAQLAKDKGLI